jgi:hypothetical protein
MTDCLLSFMESPGPWLFGMLAIFVVSLLLLIEVEHHQSAHRRRDLWRAFGQAMQAALASGVRGFFAPVYPAPWRAAWRAYRDPASRWWSPLAAWVNAVERIAFGPPPSSPPNAERDEPRA